MTYSWSAENDLLTLASDFSGTANDVSFTNSFNPAHQWITATVSNAAFLYVPPATASDAYTAVNALNQYPSVSGAARPTTRAATRPASRRVRPPRSPTMPRTG